MTHSQTIAKIFAFVGYILIIPTSFIAFFLLLALIYGLFLPSPEVFGAAFISLLIYTFGLILFIGYHKHKRGKLAEGKIIPLWIGTIVFNFLLAAPQLWNIFFTLSIQEMNEALIQSGVFGGVYLVLLLWQVLAVFMGINALINQIQINRRIYNVP